MGEGNFHDHMVIGSASALEATMSVDLLSMLIMSRPSLGPPTKSEWGELSPLSWFTDEVLKFETSENYPIILESTKFTSN